MPDSTRISLDEHFDRFAAPQVQSGRYRSASDVIRASLRLLEEREQALEPLRQALIEGEQSGEDAPLDMDEIRAEARRQAGLDA
jgi:antitoxin ParD1/3/4